MTQKEFCPTPEKAIVLQPWVLADLCIGWGICEANCPVSHEIAVRVRGVQA